MKAMAWMTCVLTCALAGFYVSRESLDQRARNIASTAHIKSQAIVESTETLNRQDRQNLLNIYEALDTSGTHMTR